MIRCVHTETGLEKYLPEKLAKDGKFLKKHSLMVQDLKEESKIFKDEVIEEGPEILDSDGIETVEAYKKKPRKRKDKLTEINE